MRNTMLFAALLAAASLAASQLKSPPPAAAQDEAASQNLHRLALLLGVEPEVPASPGRESP